MTLIYSDKGEILSAPESEDSERIQDDSITIRYFNDQNGWKFALAVKIARCIRFKPCLKSDEYLSWLTKPQKKIYGQFLILQFQQPELPFD